MLNGREGDSCLAPLDVGSAYPGLFRASRLAPRPAPQAPRRRVRGDAQQQTPGRHCCSFVHRLPIYPRCSDCTHPRQNIAHTSPATARTHANHSKQDIWPPTATPKHPRTDRGLPKAPSAATKRHTAIAHGVHIAFTPLEHADTPLHPL